MRILGRRRYIEVENRFHGLHDLRLSADKVTTLSRNSASSRGIIGLLHVPLLEADSECYNLSRQYVPNDVVRHGTIGDARLFSNLFMAIAPWISAECTKQYLDAARYPGDDFRGMVFYVPGDSTERPPDISSPQWDMDDGGSWKNQYSFPVYAIPGATGQAVVNKLSNFSGISTTSPETKPLLDFYSGYSPSAFKIYATVGTNRDGGNPSLWLFLLIVIAALGGGLILTSIFMHWRARRRQARLRRMIVNGEISLNLLGVKKVTVPIDAIHEMPLYIYTTASDFPDNDALGSQPADPIQTVQPTVIPNPPRPIYDPYDKSRSEPTTTATEVPSTNDPPENPPPAAEEETHQVVDNPNNNPIIPKTFDADAQPSCPICLDDYIPNLTIVRALPCSHIYHPECIDKFLSRNSSMCPMCKTSALPAGYCPPMITSTMVRRERDLRMRAQLDILERKQRDSKGWRGILVGVQLWWLRKRMSRNGQSLRAGSVELALRRAMLRESVARRNERRASLQRMTRSQRAEVRGRELAGDGEAGAEAVEERPRPACECSLLKSEESMRRILTINREESSTKDIPVCGIVRVDDIMTK